MVINRFSAKLRLDPDKPPIALAVASEIEQE
jgi:hypothetical protein